MGLTVTLVSGPRASGKSTVIGMMIAEVFDRPPHYVRLSTVDGGVRLPTRKAALREPRGATDPQWLCYDRERVFELLPETLAAIHRRDRYGQVVLEADSDPVLRHAYPYDQQVFVMPAPHSLSEVFRTPRQAARALQDSLDDTAEFAAEVFGLTHGDGSSDDDSREERALLSKSQIKAFLNSPLGDQLATRIQLHSAYHGLPESDVVLVNTARGGAGAVLAECEKRLERLLARVRGGKGVPQVIFCCNPTDRDDGQRGPLVEALKALCAARR